MQKCSNPRPPVNRENSWFFIETKAAFGENHANDFIAMENSNPTVQHFFLFRIQAHALCLLMLLALTYRLGAQNANKPVDVQKLPTKTVNFVFFGSKEGLSQGLVGNVIQDKEGFIWFATKDGLNRYDGYQMRVYRHSAEDPYSLPENHINSILEDPNGNFWVATATKGLWRMDKKRGRFYKFPVDLEGGAASGGLQFQKGCLLVRGRYNALLLHVQEIFPDYENLRSQPKWAIRFSTSWYPVLASAGRYFLLTSRGEIWISTHEGNLFRAIPISDGKWKIQQLDPPYFSEIRFKTIPFCIEDPLSHRVWIFYKNHGWVFDPTQNRTLEQIDCPEWDVYDVRWQMVENKLWCRDKAGNRLEFDFKRKTFTRILSNLGPEVELQYCQVDRKGNKWFGSNGKGAFMIPFFEGRFHTLAKGLSINSIQSGLKNTLHYRYSNALFFYACVPEKDRETKISFPNWVKLTDGIDSKIPDPDHPGTFWQNLNFTFLVRFDSLYRERERIDLSAFEEKNQTGIYHYLSHIDSERHLWRVGGETGGKRFLTEVDLQAGKIVGTFPFPIAGDYHEYPFVSHSHVDAQKRIWFATTLGLFCFDTRSKKWLRHWQFDEKNPNGISAPILLSLCPDPREPERYLWIGTNGGGLNKLDMQTGRCQVFKEKDGLPNEVVYGVLADEFQNLWLSTNRGLCCFAPPEKPGQKPRTRNFTREDGLAGDEFNRYSFLKLANGILAFGGVDGVTWFRPKEVLQKITPPLMALTGFSIYNKDVNPGKDSLTMDRYLPYETEVNLRHDEDMFRIEFTSLGFEPNSKKQYQYRLEGWDKNWVESGNNHFATYTNLDPGTYFFQVKGKVDEEWSQPTPPLKITITPPWWETWWFRILATASALGLLYGLYRYQLAQQLRILRLRDRIASDLHDEIGSTLNSIAFYGEAAQMLIPKENNANDVLDKINTQTRDMMESMSDIVWSLNSRNDSFSELLNRLESFAVGLLEPKGCAVTFRYPENPDSLHLDMNQRRNLYLLVKEAINNAGKYARSHNLWVEFSKQPTGIRVEIRDNGQGFDLEQVNRGNGLHTMRKRAGELQARLDMESKPGLGTRIVVVMNRIKS